jgi:aspartate ammonia-lyase
MEFRTEKDYLGEKKIPVNVHYGVQTARALENFTISGLKPHPNLIRGMLLVKKASAETHLKLNLLSHQKARAIIKAIDEMLDGRYNDQFVVDVFQAGAGTSFNMNVNEVIANRAIEILGGKKGDYSIIHPNDDVNRSQSTNDTFPTAMRIAILFSLNEFIPELKNLINTLYVKSKEFANIIKSGRTHLKDAVLITLGQEFSGYADTLDGCKRNIIAASEKLKLLGIGGSAAGTGVNVPAGYIKNMISFLSDYTGIRFKARKNLFSAMQSMADFVDVSASLRTLAIELIKIANDLRLLSSGPATGLNEIELPAVQPGSSIMPGKVNPVMAEVLNMVCFQVIGNDTTIAMSAQAGQLELNVMMPVIIFNLIFSIDILKNCIKLFTERCVSGIKANKEICKIYAERSYGLATILNPVIGYEKAAEIVRKSQKTGKSIKQIVIEEGILSEKKWDELVKKSTRFP